VKLKEKFFTFILPLFLLLVSITVMTSGYWWKNTMDESKYIILGMEHIEKMVHEGEWEGAQTKTLEMIHEWDKAVNFIQFGVERDRVLEINETLARLKAAVMMKNDYEAYKELQVFYFLWSELGS
jgi:hypothetical protein